MSRSWMRGIEWQRPGGGVPTFSAHCLRTATNDLVDMVVLGLGWNGHVAFNEPGSVAKTMTRIVALQRGTVDRNRRYWRGHAIPSHGVTIGMQSILRAKRILLLVSGPQKAQILEATLLGPITPAVPASLLRRGQLIVLADRAAAKYMTRPRTKSR